MNLMRFLITSSRGIVFLSAIAGAAGGAAGIALIALIQGELRASPPVRVPWFGPLAHSVSSQRRRGSSARLAW